MNERNPEGKAAQPQLLKNLSLAVGALVIPICLAILFAHVLIRQVRQRSARTAALQPLCPEGGWDDLPDDLESLAQMRLALRNSGVSIGEINLRIWAALSRHPDTLFSLEPPDKTMLWDWRVSQDGRYALAVAPRSGPAAEVRRVALYDFIGMAWKWDRTLPWPDRYDHPIYLQNRLLVKYEKNARLFVMELDDTGEIRDLVTLGAGRITLPPPSETRPDLAGLSLAHRNNVTFKTNLTARLFGYSQAEIPGLYSAGTGDRLTTRFSGNGLLKFDASNGVIRVSDALTQTVLHEHPGAWRASADDTLVSALCDSIGTHYTVYVKRPSPTTALHDDYLAVTLDLSGTEPRVQTDELASAPEPARPRTTVKTRDGLWTFSLTPSNQLTIVSQASTATVARVSLDSLPDVTGTFDELALLSSEHQLLLRQAERFWLLELNTAFHYADWLANLKNGNDVIPAELVALQQLQDRKFEASRSYYITEEEIRDLTNGTVLAELQRTAKPTRSSAYVALKTALYRANQAWAYAKMGMLEIEQLQEDDPRAPQMNNLLLARLALLANDRRTAALACQKAYQAIRPSPYASYYNAYYYGGAPRKEQEDRDTPMIRFQLERLFDAARRGK